MKYLNWILKHKYLTLFLLFIGCAISAYGTTRLEFVADLKVFFGKDNPQLQDLEVFENAFAKHGNVLFAIAPKKEKDIFTRQTLTAIEELTKASWQIPHSSRVNSLANFSHTWADGDELIVENLIKHPETLTDAELEKIRTFALAEPLLVNTQISVNGDLALIWVTITSSTESIKNNKAITDYARMLARKTKEKYPDLDIKVSGSEIFNFAYAEVSSDDMTHLYPIMFLVMVVMMFILIPSASGVVATLSIVIASTITAMGLAGWLDIRLTSASTAAPVIILTLAVADSMHLLVSMLYFMEEGQTKIEAIRESIRVNMQPVFLTSFTTAIGFLTLLSSDSPPFQDLGITVFIGVTVAFIYSITLLPALMAILPVRPGNPQQEKANWKHHAIDNLGGMIVNKRKPLLLGITVILLILASGFPRLELSDNFMEYFDKRYEVRQVADYIEGKIPAMGGIEYLMDSGKEGGINEPTYLAKVEAFTHWCDEQPEVSQVRSMLYTIKRLNMNMHGDDPAFYTIPENRELVAQYMLLYEMSLPFGQDINGLVTPDRSAMRFTVIQRRLSTKQLRNFEDRADHWLAENWNITAPPRGTGMGIMFAHISERNIISMISSTSLALFLISVVLIFAFRSIKIGLFSLLPNIMPAIMTFGLWGLLAGYVNMAVSYIAAMSLGIVVDDTIHFLSKYLRARRELKMSPPEAIQYSFHTVGLALLTTSLVLSVGFSVLFFSGFEVNSVMGTLMAIAIIFALLTDFFFLPPLLLLIDKKEKPEDF